jgi:hypothetical protein
MKPSEGLSEELVQAVAGLDEQMQVVEDGKVMSSVGLLATFYFLNGGDAKVRSRLVRAFERYRAAIGPKLVWGADPNTGTPKKIAGTNIADLAAWVPQLPQDDDVDTMFHGGKKKDDASAYSAQILSRLIRPSHLSHFSMTLPLEWVASHKSAAFTELVLDLCNILEPSSGYAGLAVIPHVNASDADRSFEVALGFAARFSGLELDVPHSHSIYMEQKDRIKGINWLTVLDVSWVDRLGGAATLREALGAEITVHPYSKGLVIQAGPHPKFGDTHRQEPMDGYRKVAKVLQPIRIDSISALAIRFGWDDARTEKWLQRFD